MIDSEIIFKTPARVRDEKGVWKTNGEDQRTVLARVDSVTRAEFFSGGQNGFRPELVFTVAAVEYRGEAECDFADSAYSIYRTYHVPGTDYLELYVQRKVGVNNGKGS